MSGGTTLPENDTSAISEVIIHHDTVKCCVLICDQGLDALDFVSQSH